MTQSQNPSEKFRKAGAPQNWVNRLQQMKQEAEKNLSEGALTPAYRANKAEIMELLNRALAGEWSAFLQYWHHYTVASDIHSASIREIWKEHAEEEYEHAQKINERIDQIGGVPANSPTQIAMLSPMPFEAGHDLRNMLEVDLVGERHAIAFYNEIIRTCGFDDNETRVMFEGILLDENEHANELADILFQFDASTGEEITTLHQEIGGQRSRQLGKKAAS